MILYAIVSEVSIGALFLAGIVPGVLLALLFSAYCIVRASRDPAQKSPPWAGWTAVFSALKRSIWAVLAPPIVMGGIYFGVFTAGEAAAFGSLYALVVALTVYRSLGLREIWECARQSMLTSMMVFMIIAGAAMFGHAITIIRLPMGVTEAVAGMGFGPLGFMRVGLFGCSARETARLRRHGRERAPSSRAAFSRTGASIICPSKPKAPF